MRLELTRVGLLVELANHYTTDRHLIASRSLGEVTLENLYYNYFP